MNKLCYDNINFESIELENEELYWSSKKYARISIPAQSKNVKEFSAHGYALIDRTLEVKIPLAKTQVNIEKYIRMPVIKTSSYKEEIQKIAIESFKFDNRFRVTIDENWEEIYTKILERWIDEIDNCFVCLYKDKVIGFMEIKDENTDNPFIYLAATDEKYRLTGVGMTLYAYVVNYYKNLGKTAVIGRISSKNTSVMNIYTTLGGQFSKPWDIFIKL